MNYFIEFMVKFTFGLIVMTPVCIGAIWGIKSLIVVIPVIIFIVCAYEYYKKRKGNKTKSSDIVNTIIGLSIIVFILTGIGSCFHEGEDNSKTPRYMRQRIEMGLPPY